MRQLVFFLEEPSAKAMLEGLLPRILPNEVTPRFFVFEGKQDLEKQLERRLRGWCQPNSAFIVLRDQDSGDCEAIKTRLLDLCQRAGPKETLVRIACRELESWYFGDLAAVGAALGISTLASQTSKSKYRTPDKIVNPAIELQRVTGGRYQKISGSRSIGPHLDPTRNTSRSFQVFIGGIQRLT